MNRGDAPSVRFCAGLYPKRFPLSEDMPFPKKSSAARCFTGGGRLKRQRVDTALQFFLQQRVDGAVALDATHSGKGVGNDADAEMRFAGAVVDFMMAAILMVMAGVEMAFVNDFKALGSESRGQFRFHRALFAIVNGHLSHFSPYRRCASYNAASVAKGGANPHRKALCFKISPS